MRLAVSGQKHDDPLHQFTRACVPIGCSVVAFPHTGFGKFQRTRPERISIPRVEPMLPHRVVVCADYPLELLNKHPVRIDLKNLPEFLPEIRGYSSQLSG